MNKEGEPELLIGCVTEETVGEVYRVGLGIMTKVRHRTGNKPAFENDI